MPIPMRIRICQNDADPTGSRSATLALIRSKAKIILVRIYFSRYFSISRVLVRLLDLLDYGNRRGPEQISSSELPCTGNHGTHGTANLFVLLIRHSALLFNGINLRASFLLGSGSGISTHRRLFQGHKLMYPRDSIPSNRVMSSQSANVVTCTVNFCCSTARFFMKI